MKYKYRLDLKIKTGLKFNAQRNYPEIRAKYKQKEKRVSSKGHLKHNNIYFSWVKQKRKLCNLEIDRTTSKSAIYSYRM